MSEHSDGKDVNQISLADFAVGWACVTGYRPAAVLANRRAMIRMLLDDVAILPIFPQHGLASSSPPSSGEYRDRRLSSVGS